MKFQFVSQNQSRRLIIVYAGWAMDARPFVGLHRPGYDIAVLWDYRNFALDWSFAAGYDEICVVAWSLGVYAASVTLPAIARRVTRCIAVNGTLWPVDSLRGIPHATFAGTASGLDKRQLYKFYRRVCGSRVVFERFSQCMPERDVDELVDELDTFLNGSFFSLPQFTRWDMALISTEDAIFPPVNQWRAWRGVPLRFAEGTHLPDMQAIIDRYIIDKDMMERKFEQGLSSYENHAKVQYEVIDRLATWLEGHDASRRASSKGARILEIGSGSGTFSRRLDAMCGPDAYFEMWDIAGNAPVSGNKRRFLNVDAELYIMSRPKASFDLIASASTVQWFNSPTRFLAECSRVAAPGAYVVLSTFVHGNLPQVAQASGRSLPMLTPREWLSIVPASFEVVAARTYSRELEFDSAIELLRHLKLTGVNSLGRSADSPSPQSAIRAFRPYLDGKYRLTYRPFILILKKK